MKEVPGYEMVCSHRLSLMFNPLKASLHGNLPALAATVKWLQVPAFAVLSYFFILLGVY
jgi:hypothetical protein